MPLGRLWLRPGPLGGWSSRFAIGVHFITRCRGRKYCRMWLNAHGNRWRRYLILAGGQQRGGGGRRVVVSADRRTNVAHIRCGRRHHFRHRHYI